MAKALTTDEILGRSREAYDLCLAELKKIERGDYEGQARGQAWRRAQSHYGHIGSHAGTMRRKRNPKGTEQQRAELERMIQHASDEYTRIWDKLNNRKKP